MQNNVLSQLKDIQTPEPITWWPLAWGWWLVIILVLVAIYIAILLVMKRIENNKAKKQALKMLVQIHNEPHPHKTVIAINDILKRVMLAYISRENIASMNSKQWIDSLNSLSETDKIPSRFSQLAYQPNCSAKDADEYLDAAQHWVKSTLPLSKKQKQITKRWSATNV
ncbi:DUF4381 domain-containing protein [Psychrosphaera sp.]|nr:DUF4381 domain-containing protein [Psychrosphaera sp.]